MVRTTKGDPPEPEILKEIHGGCLSNTANNGTPEFYTLSGLSTTTGTEVSRVIITPDKDIIVTQLIVHRSAAPGAGNTYVDTLRDDGNDTVAETTITGAAQTVDVWTGELLVEAQSLLVMQSDGGAATLPTASRPTATIVYRDA